jgi:hypothetical protein
VQLIALRDARAAKPNSYEPKERQCQEQRSHNANKALAFTPEDSTLNEKETIKRAEPDTCHRAIACKARKRQSHGNHELTRNPEITNSCPLQEPSNDFLKIKTKKKRQRRSLASSEESGGRRKLQ